MPYLWGKAFPEFPCDYLCRTLLCNGLTSENERGSNSSETLCGHPAITRPWPWMWGSVPDRLKGARKLGISHPLTECPGDIVQGTHVQVRVTANPYDY